VDDARQLFRGAVRLLLLERIARGETYGYALVVDLRERGLSQAAENTIYPALARLEKDGLLAARLEASGRGAARKYYRLTPEGERARHRAREAWTTLTAAVQGIAAGEGVTDGAA
jgi:PadR family transcriptional regulator, regulatory protein PadR